MNRSMVDLYYDPERMSGTHGRAGAGACVWIWLCVGGACDIVLAAGARASAAGDGAGLPPTLAMSALWDRISARGLAYLVVFDRRNRRADCNSTMGLSSAIAADW